MLKQGLRSTDQRGLIIDTFFETEEHISVDGLYKRVQGLDPSIGYATVYRTLTLMVASGVVQKHKFGDGFTVYEPSDEGAHHDHLVCLECNEITEFEEPEIELIQHSVAKRHGFLVSSHKHELYGVCAACQRPKRSKR